MKQTVECSDDLNILIERKKLLSNLKNMVEGLVFTYRKRQEFTSIPEVKEVLKTMEYRMQKNKTTKARYSTDNDFRELQKEKMRAWRNNGSNAERERKAAKKRMAKAALWKNFCAGLK
jgi:hypothetical protein